MWIAAGLVVLAGVFIAVTWRRNAGERGTGERSTGVPPVSRMGVSPMQRGPGTDASESARAATHLQDDASASREHGRDARATHGQDARATAAARATDDAAQLDRLVADVKSHADRRVGELDVLIAQARRHVEELQRQSAELAKTLQSAKNEAARRQAVAIERAAAARALAECETLAAACDTSAANAPTPTDRTPATTAGNPNTPRYIISHTDDHGVSHGAATHFAAEPQPPARPDHWPIPAQRPPSASPDATCPTTSGGAFVGSRHREVLALLDQNQPPLEISRTLGLDIGEIELIANLNGRRLARTD